MASSSKLMMDAAERAEKIKSLCTCPICNKIIKQATAICECLHTFCRKCIYKKITEEEIRKCPVCEVDLGCSPLEKLRADHNWKDVTSKIVTVIKAAKANENGKAKRTEGVSQEVEAPKPIPEPMRRKERSLSSLVSAPKTTKQNGKSRRKKHTPRRVTPTPGSTLPLEEKIERADEHLENSLSPVTNKPTQNKKKKFYVGESSQQQIPSRGTGHREQPLEAMDDLWKSLNHLADAAVSTKTSKPSSQVSAAKPLPFDLNQVQQNEATANSKDGYNSNILDDEDGSASAPLRPTKPKKKHRGRQKRTLASDSIITPQATVDAPSNIPQRRANRSTSPQVVVDAPSNISQRRTHRSILPQAVVDAPGNISQRRTNRSILPQAVVDAPGNIFQTRTNPSIKPQAVVDAPSSTPQTIINPIWFALVASEDQEGHPPLQQISSRYLKIKDPNLPVSFIKKYIVYKLDLYCEDERDYPFDIDIKMTSYCEDEVEVTLHGEPLPPNLQLQNVVDFWLQTTPKSERIKTQVGGSAKDFVMVLTYGRTLHS